MSDWNGLGVHMGNLSRLSHAKTRSISPENFAGEKGRGGMATGIVAIPNRYMHSAVETISLDDLEAAADLLAEFMNALREEDDFTP